MKLRQLTAYSDKLLNDKRMKAFLVCLMPLGTGLSFRLAEAAVCSVMLYFGFVSPAGLFTGENHVQQLSSLICTVLRQLTAAPLELAAAYWFSCVCMEVPERCVKPLSRFILDSKSLGRSLCILFIRKAAGLVFLAPAAISGYTFYSLILSGIENSEELHLFMAVHAAVTTILSITFWIWSKLTLIALPYLAIRFPKRSVLSCFFDSFGFMKGRRLMLLKILLLYIPPMLFVITIPFLLPKLFSAVSLFISISLREDEYLERNKTHSKYRKTRHASKFPVRSKKRFTPSADKA